MGEAPSQPHSPASQRQTTFAGAGALQPHVQPQATAAGAPQHRATTPGASQSVYLTRKQRKKQEAAELDQTRKDAIARKLSGVPLTRKQQEEDEAAKIEYARKDALARRACLGQKHADFRTYPLIVTQHHSFHGLYTLSNAKNLMFDFMHLGSKDRATDFKMRETDDGDFSVSFSITLPPDKESIPMKWIEDTIYFYDRDRWEIITEWQIKQHDLL